MGYEFEFLDLRKLLKSKHVQGLEIYDAHRSLNKTKVLQAVEEARSTLSSSGGGPLFLALPANPELLAKYYDLRVLVKKVDLVMVQTHALGVVKKMTYHPSRLSGMWDMMNTDSVVDLVVGLGVPASKIVISLPATAHKFTLLNETLSTPGSPTVEEEPKEIDQAEICRLLQKGRWTLERDQDLSAPYAFKNTTWMSFEDSSSVDVKGKYARVRGLAGLALHDADRDLETPCGVSLKAALAKVLNQQSRAPRAAVLRSLEHEILSAPGRALDALQVSPYRINQIVDSDGVIHSIREDTRTEFSCSRQGYFVHPRSCARFYRCVKFDQLSPDYTVFEFDCPAGLAFDARYEVCVWPGSLPSATACPGSAEIAPVPRDRFLCPDREGYYADPENCRWFFACLDHGKAPLTAYEFRCPFGLGFDAEKLKCDWPWLVPACGNIGRYEAEAYGFSSATLTGATGFHGKTADAVNIAAHQSLVSGASLDNLVGIQSGFLTKDDTLDSNFIASQELASGAFGSGQSYEIGNDASISQGQGLVYQVGDANLGLVQPTKYINAPKYTSGSIILDDYRLPSTKTSHGKAYNIAQANIQNGGYTKGLNSYSGSIISSGNYKSSNYNYDDDNSGAYIHDPSGDYAEPYKHVDSPVVPYTHDDAGYRHNGEYNDYGSSTGQGNNGGKYVDNNDGQYVQDNSGSYIHTESTGGSYSSSYNADYSDSFNSNSGKYEGGVYRADGHIGAYNSDTTGQYHGTYSNSNTGNYLSNSKAYTGASHTLTAGAVNVGLVGKTTLVDAGYTDQLNYQQANAASKLVTGHEVIHETYPGHIPYVSQPAVSINHVGTNSQNLNEYSYVTTPTSSGIPTTATPFAVTASVPVTTYRTTYVPEAPKSTVKQLFGISQPAITYVQPTAIAVKQYVTPKVEITDYNQGLNYQYENNAFSSNQYDGSSSVSQSSSGKSVTSGYEYSKPSIKFEDGISFTTPAPIVSVSTYKPQGFGHGQQTVHKIESVGFEYSSPTPITEQPFKKLVAYTTGPSVTYSQASDANLPHSYSHQTIHKVESNAYAPAVESDYDFSKSDIRYESPKPVIQLTTVQPVVSSYQQPQVYSHQTLHKVDASQVKTYSEKESELGYEYKKPAIKFEDAVNTYGYSTPVPIVVSTINPQSLEHQIIQKVETPQVQYLPVPSTTPLPAVASTYQPQVFSHQTIHKVDAGQVNVYSKNDGYEYQKPEVKFEEGIKTAYEYSTPAPIVSTYKPQSYNHQTIPKIDTPKVEITYQQTPVTVYENPLLKYTEKVIPETNVHHAYNTQAYSHQTIHKIEDSKLYTPSIKVAYESNGNYEEPTVKYTTAQPELAIQQVVSTYQPQVQSHQTLHNVEASKVNTYSGSTGYNYEAPSVKFEDGPNIIHEYSTPASTSASTYKPQSYSHQTIHKVEAQKYIPVSSTPKVAVTYQQPSVSVYENPILTYTEKVTPITYVKPTASVYTQTYQPIIHQHEVSHVSQPVKYESSAQQSYTSQNIQLNQEGYSYSQPEIQRNVETLNKGQSYSDANLVSHQFIQQSNDQYESGKDIVIVSSTPSTLAYEEHYSEYETPRKQQLYKAPEYIPPKTEYQQSYSVSSTLSPLAEQQSSIIHETDDEKYYKAVDNSPRYESIHNSPLQQISYSTSHISQPKKESIHFSSFPGTTITTKYKQVAYESPEIQVGYKAEEYLPPVVSTPIVTSTYKPSTLSSASTTREYLPPSDIKYNEREYLPPKVENTYLPPKTAKPIVISTTQRPTYKYTQSTTEYSAPEYLPPADEKGSDIVNFENFDFNQQNTEEIIKNNPYQEQYSVSTLTPLRKPNLVVERAKSNLLGFGTVGPDAGLISPVTYTTAAPVVVSSTNTPYTYIESTTQYKAPEYLPPSDTRPEKIRPVPVHRQQNIVVETAKSHLLGFGTVGPDAGLVSPVTYTTAQPIISSTDSYSLRPKTVTSTLAPFNQEISEVPIRKTKPKVAVVTKINDFNPLLVRKLGAVCSCQSPVLILKGKRPNVQVQPDVIDYNNDYDDSDRGDISDNQWGQRSGNLQLSINSATPSPIISSTINPIIVPDDSYYQDYQEPNNYVAAVTPKINELYSENFDSSTPIVVSSTEKTVRIRPRVKAVTIAPTYKTVLLNQEAASNAEVKEAESADSIINSQSFDRYGPGGWRSRDETLQGTVDCQRAGLFRHPKQCNKFYACRWDCTKQRFTLHVFNCPVQLTFDPNMGACNWPSQGPACQGDTLLTNTL
ncbi:mucin-2-like [Achroia grisella]|uniref:mucin-2-like n=1 Tax=Achroia grisella TaxID=688607 RepID=UPI0027D2EE06|nr:mucin-2-like [Achroia grisella]